MTHSGPSRSTLYLRTSAPERAYAAIGATLLAEGYVEFHGAIDARYPRQHLEVKEFIAHEQPGGLWQGVHLEDFDEIYHMALALSRHNPSLPLLAVSALRGLAWSAKFFGDGRPIAKLGEDPDHEVLYPVPQATAREFEQIQQVFELESLDSRGATAGLERLAAASASSLADFARALALPQIELGYAQLLSAHAGPAPIRGYRAYVQRDSRLLEF